MRQGEDKTESDYYFLTSQTYFSTYFNHPFNERDCSIIKEFNVDEDDLTSNGLNVDEGDLSWEPWKKLVNKRRKNRYSTCMNSNSRQSIPGKMSREEIIQIAKYDE